VSFADNRQRLSVTERAREAAFNLAEGVMSSETFLLSHNWPGTSANAYPATCSSSPAGPSNQCPDPTRISNTFTGPDYSSGMSWTVSVTDNGGQALNFYSDALASGQPTWDSNGDSSLWVRASATAGGVTRTVVALVKVELIDNSLSFPKSPFTAGSYHDSGDSGALLVDTQGSAAQPSAVNVRCAQGSSGCNDFVPSQIQPSKITYGYAGGNAMTAAVLDTYRQQAKSMGSYYTSCPSSPAGSLIFIETGNCSYLGPAGQSWNSITSPGLFIVANGTLLLGGQRTFYGIVYMANQQNSSGTVFHVEGRGLVGSVVVDGNGAILAESISDRDIVYAPSVYGLLRSNGTAGIVQNTFREVTPR
jgi:hypothetical protein